MTPVIPARCWVPVLISSFSVWDFNHKRHQLMVNLEFFVWLGLDWFSDAYFFLNEQSSVVIALADCDAAMGYSSKNAWTKSSSSDWRGIPRSGLSLGSDERIPLWSRIFLMTLGPWLRQWFWPRSKMQIFLASKFVTCLPVNALSREKVSFWGDQNVRK